MRAIPCDAANILSYEGKVSRVLKGRGYERFGGQRAELEGTTFEIDDYATLRKMVSGEAMVIPDTTQDPSWVIRPGFEWLRSWVGAPILHGGILLGFINLDSATANAFNEDTVDQLRAFAAHVAAAMQRTRLYEQLRGEHARLQHIHAISRRLAGVLDRDAVLTNLLWGSL